MLIRMPAKGISVIGRNTQGVRLITLESKEEQVVGVARVAETTPEADAVGVREAPEGAAPVESAPEGEEPGQGEDGAGGEPEGEG
jgi:DNA gyrase subunit A